MLSREELDAIKARVAAATPGPWEAERGQYAPRVRAGGNWDGDISYAVWVCDDPEDGCMDEAAQWMANAELMAHAREDVPRLLDAIKAAREFAVALAQADINLVRCPWRCDGHIRDDGTDEHAPDCPISMARTWLAGSTSPPPASPPPATI